MSEGLTEREAALAARVKELEAAAAQRQSAGAGGGLVEQIWRYFSAFVPPWIIGCGLAMFLGFHAFENFNNAKILAAETKIKKAQAAIADAQGRAADASIDGVKAQVATLAAEVAKKQNEAARARVEALTLNATLNGETTRLQQVRAELANKQAQAEKAKLEANAAGAKFGVRTLADREQRAKLVITQMEAAKDRVGAAVGNTRGNEAAILQAACDGNQFPELVGCPAQYVQRVRQEAAARTATQANQDPTQGGTAPQVATGKAAIVNAPDRFLNLRKCPKPDDRECPALRLPNGLRVQVVETLDNGWLKIRASQEGGPDVFGYVNGKYIRSE